MKHLSRVEMQTYDFPAVGQQIAVNHEDCPAGVDTKKRLYIKRTPDAVLFYCHHCSQRGYYRTHDVNYRASEVVAVPDESSHLIRKTAVDLSHTVGEVDMEKWSIEARLWWLSYGLEQEDATKHQVQWYNQRLWLNAGGTAWQGRVFRNDGSCKYLTLSITKHMPAMFLADVFNEQLVVVEDLVSAYKLNKAGYNVMCLMGTSLSDVHLAKAITYKSVDVWLDEDAAGMSAARVIMNQLKPLVVAPRMVCFKQPKEATYKQIKELLHA